MNRSPAQLRIGVCGSAGVGKTSLVNALARDLRLPSLQEEMREYLESTRVSLMDLPTAEVSAILVRLWKERMQKEMLTAAFVADNCPLDFAAYAMYYGCLDAKNAGIFLSETLDYIALYDAIVVLPWGRLPYAVDGVRPTDQHLQLRYQFVLEGLVRRYVQPQKLHFIPDDITGLDDRLSWVRSRLPRIDIDEAPIDHSLSKSRPEGFVYLVGAGPGDPALLTVRAVELLQKADVVAHDLLIPPAVLAQIPSSAELLPVGRRHGEGKIDYRLHPEVLARAQAGKVVVRLKCGDPLIFGRGGEEAEELAEAGIPFEIVPGISAALGAAAYSGIPLTHRQYASEVLFKTGHDAEPSSSRSSPQPPEENPRRTTVLFMGVRRLQANLDRLLRDGYSQDTPVALVISATTPSQQVIVATIADLPQKIYNLDPDAPALLIVGDVVNLHAKIAWYEARSLHGARIIVARSRPGNSIIARRLRSFGADVYEAPFVSVAPLNDYAKLDNAMRRLEEFDAVVFGCASGVEFVLQRLQLLGMTHSLRAIAIGDQASRALAEARIQPVLATTGSCEDAIKKIGAGLSAKRLLLITSNEGRPGLHKELLELSSATEAVAAYRLLYCFEQQHPAVDLVVLPSSSATRHLLTSDLAPSLTNVPMVAMGPITESTAKQYGARNVICSSHDEIESLISCVVHQYSLRHPVDAEIFEESIPN